MESFMTILEIVFGIFIFSKVCLGVATAYDYIYFALDIMALVVNFAVWMYKRKH